MVGVKFLPIVVLVGTVLGGIYGGFFTPTEAGGAGAMAAFLIALARRELTLKLFWQVALETGRVTAAICFLLMAAALYAQMLTLSGLPYAVGQWLQTANSAFCRCCSAIWSWLCCSGASSTRSRSC
jgi:C4-dicarboxylate transporter, DctM subunit